MLPSRARDVTTTESVWCDGSEGVNVADQEAGGGQVGGNRHETVTPEAETPGRGPKPPHERHPVRAFFARNRGLDATYRTVIGLVGAAIVIGGLALIPLPGPGWLIVFAGLAVLATEFYWAGRLLDFARRQVHAWTDWVTRQSLPVRLVLGVVGLAFIAGLVWLFVATVGVPEWVPVIR